MSLNPVRRNRPCHDITLLSSNRQERRRLRRSIRKCRTHPVRLARSRPISRTGDFNNDGTEILFSEWVRRMQQYFRSRR